jgi:hypothetical protein
MAFSFEQLMRVSRADLEQRAAQVPVHAPAMQGYTWQAHERGAAGLYVSNTLASFRNVVLEPLKIDREP